MVCMKTKGEPREQDGLKLLFVDSCISQRGNDSRTRTVAGAFLETFWKYHPHGQVDRVQLERLNLRPFDEVMLNHRDALARTGTFDAPVFDLARQFRDADAILVAAPFWDLSFPAMLRIYIEHICANGMTYHYAADGCHGDCKAQKLVYLTSGGDVEREESLGALYWKQLCRMFGIQEFRYVFAGGLDLDPAAAEDAVKAACKQARSIARTI